MIKKRSKMTDDGDSLHDTFSNEPASDSPVIEGSATENDTEISAVRESEQSEADEKKKGSRGWRVFLLIWAIVLLAVGTVTCIVLYRYAAVYEVTRPELPMEEMLSSMSKDEWLDLAAPSAGAYISEFEDADSLFRSYYNSALRDKDLSYRKSIAGSDDTTSTFVVMAKNTNLYNVVFKARDDKFAGFGRHYWKLDSVSVCDFTSNLEHISVEVNAPEGVVLSINSVPVSDEYYTGNIPVPGMSELESRFDPAPAFKCYSVSPLYGNVTVTDDKGRELHPEYDETNKIYRYYYAPEEVYSFIVEAPEDVTVKVCGAELLSQDITSSSNGIFEGFTNYTGGNEWKTVEYSYSGIFTEPVITAYDSNGTQLEPVITDTGKFIFFHANNEQLKSEMNDIVDTYFTRYMDYSSSQLRLASMRELLNCTLYGTRLNRYIRESAEGMYWASDTEVEYDELSYSDFYPVGENAFYCTIQYKANFTAQSWYEKYSYGMKNGYEMLFVREGRTWYAAEMSAFN